MEKETIAETIRWLRDNTISIGGDEKEDNYINNQFDQVLDELEKKGIT